MVDSAIKVLQGAMARSTTNAAMIPWYILRLQARQQQPGIGQAYADLLARTPIDSLAAMAIGDRYSALTDIMGVAGLTGRLSLLNAGADLLTNTALMPASVQQTPTRTIAQWITLGVRGGAGLPQTAAERAQFLEAARVLGQLPPEARDRITPYVLYLSTRDSTFANMSLQIVADMGDTIGFPELQAMLSLQRGDRATAERLARSFPTPDSLRRSTIGLTGLRVITRAVVLAELGNTRRAVETLEAIDPARFQRSESSILTWSVYVRQFALRGRWYEQLGDKAQAIAAYERFLELWAEAETPLQPQLREAREAIARLRDAAVTRPS